MICSPLNQSGGTAVPRTDETIRLADPTIFADKGRYYLYGTSGNQGFLVYESSDLVRWKGPVGKSKGYALSKGDSFGRSGFWAPQVFRYRGIYYMAYTADEQIAIASSDSPLGPFKQNEIRPLSGIGKQIDPFIFFDTDGKAYLYHVKLKEGNKIFISEMESNLTDIIKGTENECITATENWENTAFSSWSVTEGPTVLKVNSVYYMLYSANDFRSKDYAVGYATSDSAKGPWKKHKANPLISRANFNRNGTGHGDVFTDASGQLMYVMHTHFSNENVSPRLTGIVDLKLSKVKGIRDLELAVDTSTFNLLMLESKRL